MADLRPALDAPFGIFGIPATVTPPNGDAIATSVIPGSERALVGEVGGSAVQLNEHRQLLRLRRDHVPAVPRGTIIRTMLLGVARVFEVDGVESQDDQVVTVFARDAEAVADLVVP